MDKKTEPQRGKLICPSFKSEMELSEFKSSYIIYYTLPSLVQTANVWYAHC